MVHSHNTWRSFKAFYVVAKKLDQGNVVLALIDYQLVDVQSFLFNMRMKSNWMWAMEYFGDLNHVTVIW